MEQSLVICYFIGRLNPPHPGHIKSLQKTVSLAGNTYPALILLGSGGAKKGTLENPISFELKREFIEYKIPGAGSKYIIQEMGKTAEQIIQHIDQILARHPDARHIQIIHVAGEKGDDATKLNYLEPIVVEYTRSKIQRADATVEFITHAVAPEQSSSVDLPKDLSATQVRKDAYSCFLTAPPEEKYRCFADKHGEFYGEFTESMFTQIVEPAKTLTLEQVRQYIVTGELPKKASAKTKTTTKRNPSPHPSDSDELSKPRRSTRRISSK
jgi:nicotinamide mononucleotide adenylyltransferase